jgi:hypothetical protein
MVVPLNLISEILLQISAAPANLVTKLAPNGRKTQVGGTRDAIHRPSPGPIAACAAGAIL